MAFWLFPPKRKRASIRGGYEGVSVTVAGKEYRGGYRHPVTPEEVEAIREAGLAHRLVEGDPARPPRRHPADTEL